MACRSGFCCIRNLILREFLPIMASGFYTHDSISGPMLGCMCEAYLHYPLIRLADRGLQTGVRWEIE